MSTKEDPKDKAEEIVEKYSLRAPFSVGSLSRNFGIVVKELEKDEFFNELAEYNSESDGELSEDAIAIYNNSAKLLTLIRDEFVIPPVQRYVVAYLLADLVLWELDHDKTIFRSDISLETSDKTSKENNVFAMHLLMPDRDVSEKLEVLNFYQGEKIIQKMAALFKVDVKDMRVRLTLFKEENPNIWGDLNLDKLLF